MKKWSVITRFLLKKYPVNLELNDNFVESTFALYIIFLTIQIFDEI